MYKFCVWNPFLIHKNLINFWVSSMSSTNLYTDIHFTLKVKIFERTRITPTYATWMIFSLSKGKLIFLSSIDLSFSNFPRYSHSSDSSVLPLMMKMHTKRGLWIMQILSFQSKTHLLFIYLFSSSLEWICKFE